jgi:dTDP-4-amino-4,6-dideoxygalactose transaminase
MKYKIPFNRPYLVGKELFYIAQSVLSGHTAGDGLFTKKCNQLMQKKFSAKKILLTHSCTAALEMAAILCDLKPGDEVILPSYTFVSTANAFYLAGAKLIFVDIRPDTLNIDETKIEPAITSRTKVIVPVHYGGVPCDMTTIMQIAKKHDLLVVEDAAQGVNSKFEKKYLGTIGHIGAYSFHETKNIICGEGGAIVLNDERFIERAEIIREKGTNRSQFLRGEVDKYTWVDIGSSYLPSDMLAAFLYAQLENMDQISKQRSIIYNYYMEQLAPLASRKNVTLPVGFENSNANNHIFYILLEDKKTRDHLQQHLQTNGIMAIFHYIPLHSSKIGLTMGYKTGDFPVTESISDRILRLPFFCELE